MKDVLAVLAILGIAAIWGAVLHNNPVAAAIVGFLWGLIGGIFWVQLRKDYW